MLPTGCAGDGTTLGTVPALPSLSAPTPLHSPLSLLTSVHSLLLPSAVHSLSLPVAFKICKGAFRPAGPRALESKVQNTHYLHEEWAAAMLEVCRRRRRRHVQKGQIYTL